MFETLGVTFLVVAVGGIIYAAMMTREIRVAIDVPLRPGRSDLDGEVFRRIRAVPGAEMTAAGRGRYHLGRRRIPGLAYVFAVLLFPFGLLFLLIRTGTSLQLSLIEGPRPVLRIVGTAEQHVWRRVSRALAPLSVPTALPDGSWETGSSFTATG